MGLQGGQAPLINFNGLNGLPVANPLNSMNINMQMNMNMNMGNAPLLGPMAGYQGLNNAAGGVVPSTKAQGNSQPAPGRMS